MTYERALTVIAALSMALGICAFQPAAAAGNKMVCGTRTGTAGNAALTDPKGDDVIILATQGGDQHLLEETDALLPAAKAGDEEGTQNGSKYCLVVSLDAAGKPVKGVSAKRQ